MSWDLKKTPDRSGPPPAGACARVFRVESRRVAGKTSEVSFEVVRDMDLDLDSDNLLVQIPLDFYGMLKETDVADPDVRRIPVDWRLCTRSAFLGFFDRGFRVVDFLRNSGNPPANYYVLARG